MLAKSDKKDLNFAVNCDLGELISSWSSLYEVHASLYCELQLNFGYRSEKTEKQIEKEFQTFGLFSVFVYSNFS